MKTINRSILERLTGQIEGLAYGIENNKISDALLGIAEELDDIIEDECEWGRRNDTQRTADRFDD